MLIIPKRASDFFTATSLWGRARANEGTGSGGGTTKHRERNENLVITITRKQRRAVRNANFIITVCK
jgi:hypothetical protein